MLPFALSKFPVVASPPPNIGLREENATLSVQRDVKGVWSVDADTTLEFNPGDGDRIIANRLIGSRDAIAPLSDVH